MRYLFVSDFKDIWPLSGMFWYFAAPSRKQTQAQQETPQAAPNLYLFCSFARSSAMAKHHPDLIMCRKQPGIAIGRLCEKCDGKCVICDSYVRPCTLVRVCDECNYGSYQGRCVICGAPGISDAYYCKECTILEKDRDGCPKIINCTLAPPHYVSLSNTTIFLSIQWVRVRRTYFMRERNTASRSASPI